MSQLYIPKGYRPLLDLRETEMAGSGLNSPVKTATKTKASSSRPRNTSTTPPTTPNGAQPPTCTAPQSVPEATPPMHPIRNTCSNSPPQPVRFSPPPVVPRVLCSAP